MSSEKVFCERAGDWKTRSSVQLPSLASGASGEGSEDSEDVTSVSGAGLTGNTESVSESGLLMDGERTLDVSTAFRFSAEKTTEKTECEAK